jgi:hypothetical protein
VAFTEKNVAVAAGRMLAVMVCHAAYPLRLRHTPADNAERAAIDSSALRVRFECSTGPDTFSFPACSAT